NRRAKERRSIKKSDDPKESGNSLQTPSLAPTPTSPKSPNTSNSPAPLSTPWHSTPGHTFPEGPSHTSPPLKYE
ncbi:Hypothetical protein FKW44_019062, partial [Caligus rogercresseyi]